jgi:hypothetical protein
MIAKLQSHCGPTILAKITRMRNDINISKTLCKEYQLEFNALPLGVDLDVRVLKAGSWPMTMSPSKIKIPELMVKTIRKFKEFYIKNFGRREFKLVPTEGNSEIEILFLDKKYVLRVTTQMMIILLQ